MRWYSLVQCWIIPVLAPLMTQLLGLPKVCCPVVLRRRAGGVSVYQNDRRINLSCFCFEFDDRSTLVFILCLLIPLMGYPHPALFITLFLGAAYSRLVSSSAVTIQFPDNKQRAGFSSLQTSMMYLMTTAAFFPVCFFVTRPSHGATKYGHAVGGMCNYRIRNPNYCHRFAKETG